MSTQDIRVTNLPSERSQHRVAYDLMKDIAEEEFDSTTDNPREYYMTLYRQCFGVVYHGKTHAQVTSTN